MENILLFSLPKATYAVSKLVSAINYEALECISILLTYAAFTSVVMVSKSEGSCGEPTTLCSKLELGGTCGRSRVSYISAGIVGVFFFPKI